MTLGETFRLWVSSWARLGRILRRAGPIGPRRLLLLAAMVPPLVAFQVVHWLGFLLDDLLFPGYRDVDVDEPTFIVGMPRSGTTFLHATLAEDEGHFTTLRLWQLLFAPSVTERRAWAALARLDELFGLPAARCARAIAKRVTSGMDHVHPVSLDAPEEDFLFLLPAFACFLLVAIFPTSPAVWELTELDGWPAEKRVRLAAFYRSCLQRHLYCERGDARILSKNPSFTACLETLLEVFPDARFVCCFRDPVQAISSQLGSLSPAAEMFAWDPADPAVRERFVDMYHRFARRSVEVLGPLTPDRACFVSQAELAEDAAGTVGRIHDAFGWTAAPSYRHRLGDISAAAAERRGTHRHDPMHFGLDPEALSKRFRDVMDELETYRAPGARPKSERTQEPGRVAPSEATA